MHVRITFNSSYYKYMYSSNITKYYHIFRENFERGTQVNDVQTSHKNANRHHA